MISLIWINLKKSTESLLSRNMKSATAILGGRGLAKGGESEDLKDNPFFDKYSEKIRALQKTSPEEFMARLNEARSRKTKADSSSKADDRPFSNVMDPKSKLSDGELGGRRRKLLSDVMKTDLLEDKSTDYIKQLWQEYHKNKDGIAAVIPSNTYETIYQRGKKYPLFLIPLPRGQGYEFIFLQVDEHEVHFTPLINYQTHKENAPECLSIIHYPELKDKGIILMHGEFNKDVLDVKEAQCLANQFQLYYGKDNDKREKLLDRFNHFPNEFKHMDLVAELECLNLPE